MSPLTALLEEWTGLPAAIDNDANAMAYAEWLFGAGHEGVNVVCVTLGTGVGGGLILDRRLYRGSRLGAGEIGQMTIDPNGVRRGSTGIMARSRSMSATSRSRSARRRFTGKRA